MRELDPGHFTHPPAPPVDKPVTLLGLTLGTRSVQNGHVVDYTVRWLSPAQASRLERELNLTDRDF